MTWPRMLWKWPSRPLPGRSGDNKVGTQPRGYRRDLAGAPALEADDRRGAAEGLKAGLYDALRPAVGHDVCLLARAAEGIGQRGCAHRAVVFADAGRRYREAGYYKGLIG